jgi:hypothetical protein
MISLIKGNRWLPIAAALALASCGPTNINGVGTVAAKTTIAANDLYRAASRSGEDLVKLGLMDKAKFKALDAQAYSVLLQVRSGTASIQQLVAATALLSGASK